MCRRRRRRKKRDAATNASGADKSEPLLGEAGNFYRAKPTHYSAGTGFNSGAGVSAFWTPSWNQLGWMWGGFGVGEAVSTLVYPFYAATHGDPRRGLIFQGVLGTVGTIAGAFIGHPERPGMMAEQEHEDEMYWHRHHFARVRGGSLMPVQGGAGAMVTGELW